MTYRVFGELAVLADGVPVPLGGAKQRTLLGVLLIERKLVSADHLIETVWSGHPPATAQKSIQVYVSGLRKTLGEERIVTRGRGYELVIEAGEVDIDVFDELVRNATGAPPETAALQLREALKLVRGRPLSDLAFEPWVVPEVTRIEERVLAATESRIGADLELGRHADLIPELEDLVDSNPYRERLLELLMLSLYRSGRQVEALGAYRRGAARLRDELGLEPGRPLQQLEAAILRQDAKLDAPRARDRSTGTRRRGWKLATAGALAVVGAAAAATSIALTRGDAASLESIPPGVAIISATKGSLVAHVSEEEIAEPAEVVTGNGHFWVWSLKPFSLVEINPEDGRVLRRVGSPFSGDAAWFFPDGRNIWFTGDRDLVRVDALQREVVDRYRLTTARRYLGLSGWVTRCAGSLWVADNRGNAVLRVDAATGRIMARIATPYPSALACGDGDLWVAANIVRGVHRIDPRTNTIVASAETPPSPDIAVGAGYAWTSSETDGTVYKIDGRGRIVAVYETGDGARQMSFGGGRLWVANQDAGSVTGIDAATGAMTSYGFAHPVESVAVQGSKLLVELEHGLTWEDRIAALHGEVARLIVPIYQFDPSEPALATNPWIFMVERATCSTLVTHSAGGAGGRVQPDLAIAMPTRSDDGRTYTFTVRSGVRFAPPSNAPVTAADVRASIERALSSKLGSNVPGIRFLDDIVGARELNRGLVRHARGIEVKGNTIRFTLTRRSPDFLQRLALPFFCTLPAATPAIALGLVAPPSAGPYYMSDRFNGEYMILKRNPNYRGPRPARLDAIAFREGISPEHAVERVESGTWDGAILQDALLAPGGVVARRAATDGRIRTEELSIPDGASPRGSGSLYGLFSSRLGCDVVRGAIDLGSLCVRK